jgi:UDPglucose--hexose-1-phosphate uridylyltransferase
MYQKKLQKPDGRQLLLYSRSPLAENIPAPNPFKEPLTAEPHLRWHPLRGEWIAYAAYRQGRTFMPPPEYNPLGVTVDPERPTELPQGDWDIAVFDNRFPSLSLNSKTAPDAIVPARPAVGKCEVVVFSQDSERPLGRLPLWHIEMLLQVWAERTETLGQFDEIEYVLPFENRGAEVGVTLHHPHGQIYAYPVVPPVPARMQQIEKDHYERHGQAALQALIQGELQNGRRILYAGKHAVAFVPVCARYPYEVWVAPLRPINSFAELEDEQRGDLARALKTVLLKYDALWQRPFPYLMAWYQAPTDGKAHPEAHLHAEFYPPYRSADKLKHLAGTELAAGLFAMDALPEDKAHELQQVQVQVDQE